MANSRYEYVKGFERDDTLLKGCFIVVRIDGKGFTKFCDAHDFEKPNDSRGLQLMNAAATAVMLEFPEISVAFGESDEYSFVLRRSAETMQRRESKLVSLITSCFTANYIFNWDKFFPGVPLRRPPMFDGRAVLYPSEKHVRDYLAWRQVDTHINNQYNTCFWMLVKDGVSKQDAQKTLAGTLAEFKNELLFKRFGLNYSTLPEMFKKGSVCYRLKKEKNGGTGRPLGAGGVGAVAGPGSDRAAAESCAAAPPQPGPTVEPAERGADVGTSSRSVPSSGPISGPVAAAPEAAAGGLGQPAAKPKPSPIAVEHVDIIGEQFWRERPYLLAD